MKLYIGNKNYSSWSLRVWLLMNVLKLPHDEVLIKFDDLQESSTFKQRTRTLAPAGKVPILQDDSVIVWDSLAIVEYLAERHPGMGVWPAGQADRAMARSICAHVHSGCLLIRSLLPMNIGVQLAEVGEALAGHVGLQQELDELFSLLKSLLSRHEGPYLFGVFSAADAFIAPFLFRFHTYAIALPSALVAYQRAILALPSIKAWATQAADEYVFVPVEEPYRRTVDGMIHVDLGALANTVR